jgi:hypothetical protein
MKANEETAAQTRERAKDVARRALNEECDLLLACRDMASMKTQLSDVPRDVINTFVGIASEVDGLPIGAERR